MANKPYRPNNSGTDLTGQQRKGLIFYLLTLYLFLDLARPSFVWHFPKLIAVILFIAWISKSEKVKCTQTVCFFLFVAILAIDIVIAKNSYAAVWTTYGMLMLLIGICIPLINFTDTLPKLRLAVNAVLGIYLYIAVYAILNGGIGPAGEGGGQDENYVAATMTLVLPLAWFSFIAEKTTWKKLFFASLVCVYILAIVVGQSRGGFVGLLVVLGYSLMKSPNKGLAIFAVVAIGGLLLLVAANSYWEDMSTITDTSESTADLRFEFWEIATKEFLAYPLTGVGGDNFKWRMAEFQSLDQLDKFERVLVADVHSTYFQLLAEMGLAGCIVFAVILRSTYRDYRHVENLSNKALSHASERRDDASKEDFKWLQNYGRGLIAGSMGYLASAAFLSALYYSHIWVAVSLMVSLHVITTRRIDEDGRSIVSVEAKN